MKPRFSSTTSTFVRPPAKRRAPCGFERPGQADLVEPDAERRRVAHRRGRDRRAPGAVEIGLAGGDDAEARARRIEDDAVERVGARERRDRRHLRPVQPPLLLQRRDRASGC